ncbi:MAG: TauD/TfdA dioxygenase family protein [Hyphomicrobiaceae bacterium]
MAITATPLSRYVGAEVKGVDLTQPLDKPTRAAIYDLWLKHLVLLFRGQELSQEQLLAATEGFGPMAKSNRKTEYRPPGYAQLIDGIMLISNIRENGVAIGNLPDGEIWFHHDMLHVDIPHKGTCLYAVEVPSKGGNTRFANCYAAYDAMPPPLREKLEGRRAFHAYRLGEAKRGDGTGVDQVNTATHPVFRTHEETGRKAVYVNRLMTESILGMDADESRETLETVFAHSENPEWTYEHVWQPHDLLVWDNRCSMHARTDFSEGERRLMLRTTIAGNVRPT